MLKKKRTERVKIYRDIKDKNQFPSKKKINQMSLKHAKERILSIQCIMKKVVKISKRQKLQDELETYIDSFNKMYPIYANHILFIVKTNYVSIKDLKTVQTFLLNKKNLYDLLNQESFQQIQKNKVEVQPFYNIYFSLLELHFNFFKKISKNLRFSIIQKSLNQI